ncbi:MAG: 30S ribosomal protein S9 [Bdellovibrionota bacterium]
MPKAHYKFSGVGKRKSSIARVYMNKGKGTITVNGREFEEYFPTQSLQKQALKPLEHIKQTGQYDIHIRVLGGGVSGQAQASGHGIARALLTVDDEMRASLKPMGFLTRDSRTKERKKYGQPGARKKFQYSKR